MRLRFSIRRFVAVFMFVGMAFTIAPAAHGAIRANPACFGPLHILGIKLLDRICVPTTLS